MAPTVAALGGATAGPSRSAAYAHFYVMFGGAVVGGVLYFVLDQVVNAKGGFLRRTATTVAYLRRVRQRERADTLHELSKFGFLHMLAPEHIDTLLSMAQPTIWPEGTVLAAEGEQPRRVMLVTKGEIVATSSKFDELHGGRVPSSASTPSSLASACRTPWLPSSPPKASP